MDWDRLEGLLDELLDLPEPDRAARLAGLERSSPDLAIRLRDALGPDRDEIGLDRLDSLMEAAAAATGNDPPDPAQSLPGEVGPWQPVSLIASGGMGDVYVARRVDGEYEETAALKRLRYSVATAAARDRFLRERQVLADLRHPHIATLLDGGVDRDGVPYFVMEYVDGLPITDHCDRAELGLAARLKLFEQVTDAVAAAHQKLVVHRDLKPANILVSAAGAVKLVDFGIAKLLTDPDDAGMTGTHERVLTLRYAAPEQLTGAAVTTATDVYGLGIVLYELLSGCQPHTDELLRTALGVGTRVPDPPRMSVACGRLDPDTAATVAGSRGTTARLLVRQLRGDLDEIVAKALRPEPGERYPTVASLAEDLRRERDLEPVEAHRGSWLYRGRKLWARHWLPLSAVALVVASLTVGLWIAVAKTRAARIAESRAAAVNRFLTEELLGSADPSIARGRDLTVREVLEVSGRSVGFAFKGQPAVEASVRRTLGAVSARLGEVDDADEQLTIARGLLADAGADRCERARLASAFAELDLARGRFDRARTEIRAAVDGLTATLGEDSLETLQTRILAGRILTADGDVLEAERLLREIVERLDLRHPDEPTLRASARAELASALKAQGRRDEALDNLIAASSLQESALGTDHPDLAQTLEQMADIYAWIGLYPEAEAAARRALAIDHKVFGPGHWRSAHGAYVLASALLQEGRTDEDREVLSSALAVALPELGESHPEVVNLRNALAVCAVRRGDVVGAAADYRAALEGAERGLGAGAPLTMMIRRNFSNFLAEQGNEEESLRLARVVLELGVEAAASDNPDPMYLANVAWFLADASLPAARNLDTALELAGQAVDASRGRWYYPWVALSEVHFRRGELDEAIEAERRAVSLPDGLHLPGEDRYLVELLSERGDLAGAESFLREHLRRRLAVRPPDDPLLGHTRALLGRVMLAEGRLDEAGRELEAALAQYDRRLGADHEWRIPALSDLGAVLAATGRAGEAEEILRRAERLAMSKAGEQARKELAMISRRLDALERDGSGDRPPKLREEPRAVPGGAGATPAP